MIRYSLFTLLSGMLLVPSLVASEPGEKMFAIAIHGGAGGNPDAWPEEYRQARRDGLSAALDRGVELLSFGKPALDVVEEVVRLLEDDEHFNAGRGCVLNENGEHELLVGGDIHNFIGKAMPAPPPPPGTPLARSQDSPRSPPPVPLVVANSRCLRGFRP